MELLASQVSSENDSGSLVEPVHVLHKRKEYSKEATPLHTGVFDHKRRRQNVQVSSCWPPSMGTAPKSHKGEGCTVDTGVDGNEVCVSSVVCSVRLGVISAVDGQKERSDGDYCTGQETHSTSAASFYGSSPGNASTVTTLNEEGESTFVQSSGQAFNVVSQADAFSVRYRGPTKCIGSAGKHVGRHKGPRNLPSQFKREIRKCIGDCHGDGEVMSPLSEAVVTSSIAREDEVNRMTGLRARVVNGTNSDEEKSEIAGLTELGCSSVKTGERDWVRHAKEYSYSKRKHDGSGEIELCGSSQEQQSSSIVTDLGTSSCSASIFSGVRSSSYKQYRVKEPFFDKETDDTIIERDPVATAAEIVANDGLRVVDEHMSRRLEEDLEIPHLANNFSEDQQENCFSVTGSKSSDDGVGKQCPGDGGCERQQNSRPTFVLSSGRLSKEQQKQCGMRPTTIDDDFDQYFAQLML